MSVFNPEKLYVEFREGITPTEPIIHRRYTLTHSDLTGDLFLTIGLRFAWDKINPMRDEVRGEWIMTRDCYVYHVYLDVDGQFNQDVAATRNDIFRRELPLALEAIRYGDSRFFMSHPELNNSPIIVHFISSYPQFNTIENWGTFAKYATPGF
ncbi:staygreen family protein [Virgibacillus flavescens]|uniref:staygreen family protein n=1 Tax=Virgibacillus flavescens TaxID=1611422 RepID=UPI003D335B2B